MKFSILLLAIFGVGSAMATDIYDETTLPTALAAFQGRLVQISPYTSTQPLIRSGISDGRYGIHTSVAPLAVVNSYCDLKTISVTGTASSLYYHCFLK